MVSLTKNAHMMTRQSTDTTADLKEFEVMIKHHWLPKTGKRMLPYRYWGMAVHCLHTVKQLVGRSMFLPAVEQWGADWPLLPPGRTAVAPEDDTGLSQ